jgi:hypothetical protein
VGLRIERDTVALEPRLPPDWPWLRLHNLPYRSRTLSFFLARQDDGLHVYTCDAFEGDLVHHGYEEELPQGVETITTGVSITAQRGAAGVPPASSCGSSSRCWFRS